VTGSVAAEIREPVARGGAGRKWSGRTRFAYGLIAVLAVALLVRVVAIVATPHFVPINDSADYDRYAVSLAVHGHFPRSQLTPGPTAFRAPLFPVALAAVYKLVGVGHAASRWEAGRVLEAVLGTVTVALICLIALRLWGGTTALVAGALAAVYLPLVLVGASLMSESLYIPLGLAAVLAALVARDRPGRLRWAVLAGVLVGLATLTRSTDLLLVVPIALIVWVIRPLRSWRSARAPLVVVCAALATLAPWLIRDAAVLRTFVPITDEGGYALIGTYNAEAAARADYPALYTPPLLEAAKLVPLARGRNEAQFGDRLTSTAFDYASAHRGYVLKVAYWSIVRLLDLEGTGFERWIEPTWGYTAGLSEFSVYAFWVIGALALAGLATGAARRAPAALWLCPVALVALTIPVVGATRYRSPADPFVILLAALALVSGWRRLPRRVAR
jgi:hypothetical protein